MMKANKDLELILSLDDDGIVVEIFKRQQNGLIKIDHITDRSPGFKLIKNVLKEIEILQDGTWLYNGDKSISEVNTIFMSLGFTVGIELVKEKTEEEKIDYLEKKMNQAVSDEDYMKAASLRDEIKKMKENNGK